MPTKDDWTKGIGHLVDAIKGGQQVPEPLKEYGAIAYHDKNGLPERFPEKRTFLGSAAQVFHILREKEKRIRMTLFEMAPEPAEALLRYFADQGAHTSAVGFGDDNAKWVKECLRDWWRKAVETTERDMVMVVQANSWKLAPCLWNDRKGTVPDLVFVDPFKTNDPSGEPLQLLASLGEREIPTMCWTPLNRAPKWPESKWSFESDRGKVGSKGTRKFVDESRKRNYQVVACCWAGSAGNTRNMYGCQLTFGNVFNENFTADDIWPIDDRVPSPGKPGFHWWDKYSVSTNVRQQGLDSSACQRGRSDHEKASEETT